VKRDCLIAGGAWGGDAARLLECASVGVAMSALLQALRTMFGQHTCATMVEPGMRN
jgi:hypothetical protein